MSVPPATGKARGPNTMVLLVGFALLLPLFALLAYSFGNDPRHVPFLLEGTPAASFELQTLDGETVTLDDFKGQPLVINFWSTWCQPCKIEHPVLQRAPKRYPHVAFLGVIYQDEANKAKGYLQFAGTTYRHLIDPGGRTAVQYGVVGVPETYFIDGEGTIIHKQVGPVDDWLLQKLLVENLGGTP